MWTLTLGLYLQILTYASHCIHASDSGITSKGKGLTALTTTLMSMNEGLTRLKH